MFDDAAATSPSTICSITAAAPAARPLPSSLACGARATGFDISNLRLEEAPHHTGAAPAAYTPALAAANLGPHPRWQAWQRHLAAYDRHLFTAWPWLGRYAWETVVVVEK